TIRSSNAAGSVTVTATDSTSAVAPASATLTQTSAIVGVTLSPTSIVADGVSTTVATVTVTDPTSHQPVQGDTVTVGKTDPGQTFTTSPSGTTASNGTFTVTIRSSTTTGSSTITATDNSAPA